MHGIAILLICIAAGVAAALQERPLILLHAIEATAGISYNIKNDVNGQILEIVTTTEQSFSCLQRSESGRLNSAQC